jgi:hypothetical protein
MYSSGDRLVGLVTDYNETMFSLRDYSWEFDTSRFAMNIKLSWLDNTNIQTI